MKFIMTEKYIMLLERQRRKSKSVKYYIES